PSPNTVIPLTDRTGLLNAFDPNFVSPYIQNLTLSLTRSVTSKLTLDLRYIGTLSRKLQGNMDLNAPNFLYNGLKEAFDAARSGGESPLLDQMFAGLNIGGTGCNGVPGSPTCGPVGGADVAGVAQRGAAHLRAATFSSPLVNLGIGNVRSFLANGQYANVASLLNLMTNAVSGSQAGSVLNYSGKFPQNFIKTNPQVNTSVMENNLGYANYHSLQTQISLNPTAGVSTQLTYTWSRNLGFNPGGGANGTGATMTDPTNRALDYTLLNTNRKHVVVNYGSFELPIGPSKLLFGNLSGVWARLAENWQASWIVNLSSGGPGNISAQSMLYG